MSNTDTTHPAPAPQLLAIVEVDRAQRVTCQAPGCGHSVYKRIHVVRQGATLGVYGSDCFARLFGGGVDTGDVRYGGGAGRLLTQDERDMLASNTQALIDRFEAELQAALDLQRQRMANEALEAQALRDRMTAQAAELAAARAEQERHAAQYRAALAQREALALIEAKQMVRDRHHVNPDLPGFVGLVKMYQKQILAR